MAVIAKYLHRLIRDIGELTDGQATVSELDWEDGRVDNFTVEIRPNDGYYKGGVFEFIITIPSDYEDDAPLGVFCITDIYHPNIDTSDMFSTSDPNVCLNLLDSRKWSRKFGLEAAVLGLVFLLHNPNLSDPLFSDIERDKETFEKNVKKYMRGEDVDGRSFAADFLNDLQAQNTKNESTDKIVEPSNSVYYTNENDVTEIQSIDGINNSNGDNEANTLLEQLKQLGIETVDDNVAGACALVALDNDTVLVPYESTEIIKDLKSTSEMKQHCDLAVKID